MTIKPLNTTLPPGRVSLAPPSRRPDVQGLRAVAVLLVVAFHAGLPVPGGFVGVDVFFVISGFVITSMLHRELLETGRIGLAHFYIRRFKRLTPALALMVAVVMAASVLILSPIESQGNAALTALGAIFLVANVVIARTTGNYFDADADTNPLLHTWSLSVEEQFYLIFPVMLLIGWRLGSRYRRATAVSGVAIGIGGAISLALALGEAKGVGFTALPESFIGFYGPATRAWEFAAGVLLALGARRLTTLSTSLSLAMSGVGAALLCGSLWLISDATPFPGPWTLVPVCGTLLLIAAGPGNGPITRLLAAAPMGHLGDRSYSIYLWHWPFIVFAQLSWPASRLAPLLAVALSFVPAYLSYALVEQPIRTLPSLPAGKLVRLVAAAIVPPLVLAGTVAFLASKGYWNATIQRYQSSIETPHAAYAAGCVEGAWRKPAQCTWNGQGPGAPIYLVGDSQGDHFSEALIAAASSASRPMTSLTEYGCSYLPSAAHLRGPLVEERCLTYPRETEKVLRSADPGLVVIANRDWFISDVESVSVEPSSDILAAAVNSLQNAGHQVLIVQTVPHWLGLKRLDWATCSGLDIITDGCPWTMSSAAARALQREGADVVRAVALRTSADVLDLWHDVCPGRECSAAGPDGLIRYRDSGHLTVAQSAQLSASFAKAIASASG